jgi:biofilm PGA synthesis N-glycosyltransferase PgaC
MEVPTNLGSLWAQRRRWARGQGEVLHKQLGTVRRWGNRRLWPLAVEGLLSLTWILLLVVASALTLLDTILGDHLEIVDFTLGWGIAITAVAMIQMAFALGIEHRYDPRAALAFFAGPLYWVAYWTISGAAALCSEGPALIRGPHGKRVVWNIERETVSPAP